MKNLNLNWLFWIIFVVIGGIVYVWLANDLSCGMNLVTTLCVISPIIGFRIVGMLLRRKGVNVVYWIVFVFLFITSYFFWVYMLVMYGPKTLENFLPEHIFFLLGLIPWQLILAMLDSFAESTLIGFMFTLSFGFIGFLWILGVPGWILVILGLFCFFALIDTCDR